MSARVDDIARRQEAHLADSITRAAKRRGENALLGAMVLAFEAAIDIADPIEARRRRDVFKTAQIDVAAMCTDMAPGHDRRVVWAFVQMSSVWSDFTGEGPAREWAKLNCLSQAHMLKAMRLGGKW